MLDFGWSEFILILILGVVLLGPKEIPEILYWIGRVVRRLQYLKFALSKQFDTFMEQAELDDLKRGTRLGTFDPKQIMTPLPKDSASIPTPAQDDTMDDDDEFYGEVREAEPNKVAEK